jgi:hypothetical protein
MTVNSYYPISYLPAYTYNTEPITFNSDYINNLISLGVTDYFSPTQFVTNPLFANVDSFNQNVGILQTATSSLEKVLTLIDDLKNINNPTQDVVNEFETEINDILKNTTYDNLNIFDQTLNIDGQNINLSVPLYDPNTYTIEEYEKVVGDKYNSLYSTLQNLTFTLPSQTSFNPYNIYYPQTSYNAFDYSAITPDTLELLLL